ncbi:hypothetical protein DWB61_01270 [Ancylomarina euxinus]|uniref:DUF6438 domain-containing protein n=1 Tax=Ancylomarina euxinus TaxID=2283627 RepID=A0A425Y8M6_9BACT|nr:DUF6438 domain-containing protein [Ancylomarina euxinus]MCZ4693458.1 DUF6438 domain-containing protein [Ancylomarina euxinus]MUP13685.1 hypothetical protein [Ancylomarina euxinus]RRG24674.1 hypothetical protein DWB61_01270 [Ancylomarina euxinus]
MKAIGILVAILLISCSAYQKAEYSQQSNLITLIKSRCRGKCPVYELNINTEGEALYHGISNVTHKGLFKFKLSKVELDKLQELFIELKFQEIKLQQKTKYRDVPYTTLKYKGKSHYYRSSWNSSPFKGIVEKLDELIQENVSTSNKKKHHKLTSMLLNE